MTDVFQRADEIYAGMLVALAPRDPVAPVGLAEILRYLTEPAFGLTEAQIEKLERTPALRQTYEALVADMSMAVIPLQAAAADSDDAVPDSQPVLRRFDGGTLSLLRASHPGIHYLRLAWDEGQPPASSLVMHLSGEGVLSLRLALPPADADGTINELLNEKVPAQAALIAAIHDPRSQGHILPQQAVAETSGDTDA